MHIKMAVHACDHRQSTLAIVNDAFNDPGFLNAALLYM